MERPSLRFLFNYLIVTEREFPFPQKQKIVRRLKEEIRETYKEREKNRNRNIDYERHDDETTYTRYSYPLTDFNNILEFNNYIDEYYYIDSPHSPYDCTGRLFTRCISCFKLNDKWVSYVVNTLDV